MAAENSFGRQSAETLGIRLTGKNYATWEFQFRMFLKGKELWGHIDGSSTASGTEKEISQWESNDSRIISWILASIEPHMVNSLRSFNTAKEIWNFLKRIYHQHNTARRFQLELDISKFSQGNLSIEQYYSAFLNLWGEYSDIIYFEIPKEALASFQKVHQVSMRDQFLMKLRPEFETARGGLLNRNPVPSLDVCVGELLREEQRLATQSILSAAGGTSEVVNVAYAAQGRNRGKGQMQCYSCKEFGHIARNCGKKFCSYCKQSGHILKECPTRPENRRAQAFQATVPDAPVIGPTSTTSQTVMTPEMVQQMILTAFSALGLQGQGKPASSTWFIDSGATNHMTGSSDFLQNLRPYTGCQNIQIANGSNLPITAIGDIGHSFRHVFVAPKLSTNLISVGQLVENHCDVHFSRGGCLVQDQMSGKVIAKGPRVGRLFPLQFTVPRTLSLASMIVDNKAEIWHRRLGHPNNVILSDLIKRGFLGAKDQGFAHASSLDCSVCKLGKSKMLPFPTSVGCASACFEIIHSDVWGITPVISHAQYKYFVTFIDDYSRFTWIYFLRTKAEVFTVFQTFVAYIETQFSTCIKILRSDNGGEYVSHDFQAYLQRKGIVSQRSCPYTPQQNGVAERKNRHLLDMVRTLLLQSSVPPRFWVEALSTAVYLINRLPSQQLGFDSPYYRLFGVHPNYHMLHTFGCVCFVHLPPHERHKLAAQSVRCAFMGYSTTQKGFLCYDAVANRLRVSRHVIFFEHEYYFQQHTFSSNNVVLPSFDDISPPIQRFRPGIVYQRRRPPSVEILPDPAPLPTTSDDSVTLRRSSRISKPPDRYGFSAALVDTAVPSSYSQATKHACWVKAMDEELQALLENHTWDIVPCPTGVKPIGCKWVYSIKLRSDGTLDRHKARLVALGNRQEYGINYEETFAPVAKMTTVRLVLAIAASKGWSLRQMDVKNAFLHGDLKEDIYMTPPPGLFSTPSGDVCKLKRSLYGLKQAPRAWFDKFRSTLLGFSFVQSQYDSSLFLCKTSKGIVILLVYVDDIVITGTDYALISQLQDHLQRCFHMKDLGSLQYFLGLEVYSSSTGIFLTQHKYIRELIALAGLQDGRSVDTPLEVNVKYRHDEGDLISDPSLYRQLVGSLNYLTITRPDISFAVQQVSQFMQAPRHLHLAAVRRIVRYLKGTSSRGLFFPANSPIRLIAYSDADWAGCSDTRRSVTGWCMFLGTSLVSWKSKKQDRVSKSSTESEYRAMSSACSEIVWLRGLLGELGFPQKGSTPLHADNTSAIQIAANPVFHERTKHIEVDCHSIRESYDAQVISLPHIPTDLQIADVFTKALSKNRHHFLVDKLMLVDQPASI